MNTLDKILIGLAVVLLGGALALTTYSTIITKQNLAGNFNPTGAGTYLIQSSITSSQSTITLSASTPFNEPTSNIPYTMTYLNSNIEYGTLNPASGQPGVDNSEFISFTGITQNSNGSATLTGVTRGLARTPGTGGCVASSTLAHAYPSQTKFILSNSPCFYSQYAVKQNNETILGHWTFSSTSPPQLDYDPTAAQWGALSSSSLVTYHLLATTALAGATNASLTAKGIVQIASSTAAASSTNIGSSGALDVLSAAYATDTPQSCSGLRTGGCVVMSLLTGKLSQLWLDLTQSFNFTGQTYVKNLNASSTVTVGGVALTFPPTSGASSSILESNGSGSLFFVVPPGTPRYNGTGAGLSNIGGSGAASGTSTEQIIIPANVITASSTIDIYGTGTCTSGGGGTTPCLVAIRNTAGTVVASFTVTAQTSNSLLHEWHAVIMSNSSASSQNTLVHGSSVQASTGSIVSGEQTVINTVTTGSLNLSAGATLVVTLGVGANSGNSSDLGQVTYIINP